MAGRDQRRRASLTALDAVPTKGTGATGAYDGASGTAVVTDIPGTAKSDIRVTLLP
jgi:hypothetical protein